MLDKFLLNKQYQLLNILVGRRHCVDWKGKIRIVSNEDEANDEKNKLLGRAHESDAIFLNFTSLAQLDLT